MDDDDLPTLLESAREVKMSAAQREEQRRSFAYGNIKIENDRITRETIDRVAERLSTDEQRRTDDATE